MFEPQHLMDLQDNGGFADSKSWLQGDGHSSPTHSRTHSSLSGATSAAAGTAGNVDRVLFNDLVEIVPLVQSLIGSSFTRRGSMIYTKTPSRESFSKKITEPKGKNAAHSIPSRKQRDRGDKVQGKSGVNNQEGCVDGFSIFSSREDKEELILLREQLEDLQKKLLEKDELLKSAEIAENQMAAKLDELKHQAAEKESLMKSIQLQFSNAKIKLADKQAALEKTQWEAQASHRKVEKLQEDLDSLQGEISSYMMIFEGLTKNDSNDSTIHAEDYDIMPNHMNPLPEIDDLDELEMQKMEEAREAYVAAVAAAKDKQDEESITAAASARLHLQSFLFRTEV
ncbi:protein MICROTUBULE BINDING PROTEIN 2C isoform X2 [Malania oleifera]|uniref:protein MICROTUBULE BINDING PROTEIN 2C isoform X2 n=1 Tax=Malania oleifera TaxID=397392 RepID=UPI0025AE2FB9|nr:protein MICROTUBULE BINDING PROTEIN 2C isoform X2 [Malania oleifera]XP_057952388.1 protein MICROTUBULE BINDING PROTEIN 2C isoform X2 [Malania oleifera]